jgi:TPR repeat protein
MYNDGQGVPQDPAEALKWFRKAAEQGEARGLFNLGIAYSRGNGVPQDYVQAHVWFSLAALLASEKEDRDGAAKARDLLSSEMSTAQVTEAEKLAREWWPKPER